MIRIDRARDMLGAIDVQPCFMPGGALPVPEGEAVVPAINALTASVFARGFATQDWHPPDHLSFASQHPGASPFDVVPFPYGAQTLWPDHAVRDTAEAALHPALDTRRFELILRKGTRRGIDSYSAFRENDGVADTGLAAWLRALGISRVFLAGLALDYCVAFSAGHAAAAGFETWVIADACRAIGDPATSLARMERAGVRFTTVSALLRSNAPAPETGAP